MKKLLAIVSLFSFSFVHGVVSSEEKSLAVVKNSDVPLELKSVPMRNRFSEEDAKRYSSRASERPWPPPARWAMDHGVINHAMFGDLGFENRGSLEKASRGRGSAGQKLNSVLTKMKEELTHIKRSLRDIKRNMGIETELSGPYAEEGLPGMSGHVGDKGVPMRLKKRAISAPVAVVRSPSVVTPDVASRVVSVAKSGPVVTK